MRKVWCPKVEQATFNWFTIIEENRATLSNDLVIAGAKQFYGVIRRDPSEKELQFSHAMEKMPLGGFKDLKNALG